MEAAVHGDLTLLKQAMLHDPLWARCAIRRKSGR